MFFVFAIFTMFGPVIAVPLSVLTAVRVRRVQPLLAFVLIALALVAAALTLWQFQYDLGITLPDLPWMPNGHMAEVTMAVIGAISLACLGLILGWASMPRALPALTALVWAGSLLGYFALTQMDFRF